MSRSKRRLLPFVFLSLSACGWSGGPLEGSILDEETRQPIPGAIVTATWQGRVSSIVDSRGVCIHAASTVTDNQGRYHFAPWKEEARFNGVSNIQPSVVAYKKGFELPARYDAAPGINYLRPFRGSKEERIAFLKRMATGNACTGAGESGKSLYSLYEALYYEAKDLASSEAQFKDLNWLREMAARTAVAPEREETETQVRERVGEFLQGHLR